MIHMSERNKTILGILLFIMFMIMMIVGSQSPEAALVYTKAKNICLECIGIG